MQTSSNAGKIFSRITRANLLVVSLVFLSLLSLALLITVIVQSKHHGETTKPNNNDDIYNQYCLNRECLSGAAHQLRSIDSSASIDRCTDFHKYACGTWQQTHPIESFEVERTILGDMIHQRDKEIERLLDSPITRTSTDSWEWKIKMYYKECIDDYARATDSGKALISVIQDRDTIDGWFLIDNSAEGASQDYLLKNQTIYQQISSVFGGFGATVVFDIRVRFDDTNPKFKRLEFFPAGLTMEVNDYLQSDSTSEVRRSAYKRYIVAVLALLAEDALISDGNLSDRFFTIADDIIFIEKSLAEFIKLSENSGITPLSPNLQDMSNLYSFDFLELMSLIIGDPSIISYDTIVHITNSAYFQDAFALLLKNNEPLYARQFHNYMRWRFVRTYIEDLSYRYVHEHRVFLDAYYGYALHSTNEAYCTREVIQRFPLAIQRLYIMNSTTYRNTAQTVEQIFVELKDAFKKYIYEEAAWMPDEPTKAKAREKIDALSAVFGYASIVNNDTSLDEYYKRFVVDTVSHFENAYGYFRFHGWTLSNSLLNPEQLDHWDYFEMRPNRLFEYFSIFNQLFVTFSVMRRPLISNEWPLTLNMGSIGVLLAEKLFSSIDTIEGRTHSANGTQIPDWWSSATADAYNASRRCITNYYTNDIKTLSYFIYDTQVIVNLAGEPFSPTTLRQIGSIRLAYRALTDNDRMKSLKMPGTNLTSQQTFFLAYAQTQCYQRQELVQYLRTQFGVYDERTALNAALIHMPEFAEAFQCKMKEDQCF